MTNSACYDPDEQEVIHRNYSDTGQRGTNPLTGDEFQIWECACGANRMEVFK